MAGSKVPLSRFYQSKNVLLIYQVQLRKCLLRRLHSSVQCRDRTDRTVGGVEWRVENQSHLITFNACLNSDNRVRHFFDIGRRSGITKLLGQQNPIRNIIYMDHRIARQWRLGWDEISMRCKTYWEYIIIYPKLSCIIQGLGFALAAWSSLWNDITLIWNTTVSQSWSIPRKGQNFGAFHSKYLLVPTRIQLNGIPFRESPFENSLPSSSSSVSILDPAAG